MVEGCAVDNNALGGVQSYRNNPNGAPVSLRISNSTVTGIVGSGGALRQGGGAQLLSRLNNTVEGNGADTVGTIGTYPPR